MNQTNKTTKTTKGLVIEQLPDTLFRIQLENEQEIIAYLAGKIKHNHIKVLTGDTVAVVIDPYGGKTSNRIIERL